MKIGLPVCLIAIAAGGVLCASSDRAEPAGGDPPSKAHLVDLSALPAAERFDFLIGEWSYRFDKGHGSTSYRRVGGGAAIQETLKQGFISEREFSGSSIFLFDPGAGQWHHNWIDTLGNVLEGTGSMAPYETSALPAMITVASLGDHLFKHVWYDISPGRFETDLYVSTDGGATYSLIRRMPFLRLERTSRR